MYFFGGTDLRFMLFLCTCSQCSHRIMNHPQSPLRAPPPQQLPPSPFRPTPMAVVMTGGGAQELRTYSCTFSSPCTPLSSWPNRHPLPSTCTHHIDDDMPALTTKRLRWQWHVMAITAVDLAHCRHHLHHTMHTRRTTYVPPSRSITPPSTRR